MLSLLQEQGALPRSTPYIAQIENKYQEFSDHGRIIIGFEPLQRLPYC